MENLEFIDSYFTGIASDAQKIVFEKRIAEEPSFASDVAFYISTHQALRESIDEEKKKRFREIFDSKKAISLQAPVRSLWKYAAAASIIIAVILITWTSLNKTSPQQLANIYIEQHFKKLGVNMGSKDSLQNALDLFNSNKLDQSLPVFESLIKNNSQSSEALKYAGITYLRLGNYDKALEDFKMLSNDSNLYSNPGKFYEAVTLLKRNKNDDVNIAKQLLNEVINKNLEGKNDAEALKNKL